MISNVVGFLAITFGFFLILMFQNFAVFSDVVYIGNTTAQHYDVCKMMLLADKHVLCEKSLTCSVEQSEELFNLAKERKRFLMEVRYCFTPVLLLNFLTPYSLSVFQCGANLL